MMYRGLNLDSPDHTSQKEVDDFFGFKNQPTGGPLPSYGLWAELRPDVLKRGLRYVTAIHRAETWSSPLPFLNVYTTHGYSEGVSYCIQGCQAGTFKAALGYTRKEIIETLSYSFYLSPSWGTSETAATVKRELAAFVDPPDRARTPWPAEWKAEPEKLKAGLDYTTPDLGDAEKTRLWDWYMEVLGEIPPSAEFYAKYRPGLLKADRFRWENIITGDGLPNQALGYFGLHYETWRRNTAGMREALVMARGLGLTKVQALDAIGYGAAFYGGTATIAAVQDAVGELLDRW